MLNRGSFSEIRVRFGGRNAISSLEQLEDRQTGGGMRRLMEDTSADTVQHWPNRDGGGAGRSLFSGVRRPCIGCSPGSATGRVGWKVE